jgi:hypothetical protein
LKDKTQSINTYLAGTIKIICFILFILIFYFSLDKIINNYQHLDKWLMVRLILTALLLVPASYTIKKWLSRHQYIFLLMLGALVVRIIWIIYIKTEPISDFYLMYNGALSIARGDYSFSKSSYFTTWVYQLGYTVYQGLITTISGEGTFLIKLLNCIYSAGTALIIYLITAKCFNEFSGRAAGILYAFNIPSIALCSVLSNQHIATFLFCLGLYLLIIGIHENKYVYWIVGFILSMGNIMRPLGIFVLAAITVSMIIKYGLLMDFKNKVKRFIIDYGKIIISYFVTFYLVSYLIIGFGITEYPLYNRNPLLKFVLGLNYETTGIYSQKDIEYLDSFPQMEEKKREEKKMIHERISDRQKLIELFNQKYEIMWGDIDSSVYWSFNNLDMESLQKKAEKYERIQYTVIILFILVSLGYLIVKHNTVKDIPKYMVFILLIVGYIFIHQLIEIQTRYRHFILPSFQICAGYGIYVAYNLSIKTIKKYIFKH